MTTFLVARVVDVTEQPVTKLKVTASFDGGATHVPLEAVAAAPGVYEVALPDGTKRARLTLPDHGQLWGVVQDVLIGAGSPPTINPDGPTAINVRAFTVHTRGADVNVEVHVVQGMLRDARAKVDEAAAAAGLDLSVKPVSLRRLKTPMLKAGAAGADVFDQQTVQVTPPGTLFFLERVSAPQLIAVHHPGLPTPTDAPEKAPIPFHVNFHPFINTPPFPVKGYPFQETYLNLIQRYCLMPWRDGKAMIHQSAAGGGKAVFVFPVGGAGKQMGTLNTPSALLRLLEELAFWLQRKLGAAYPRQPVGPVMLSGFSAGIRFLNAVAFGGTNARLQDELLKHIVSLDGVFAGKGGTGETVVFCNRVKAWHRKGADGRTFRVYTQSDLWWQQFAKYESPTIVTAGSKADTARVADTTSSTVLHTPARDTFWRPVEPWVDDWIKSGMQNPTYWMVHQLVPGWFLEHAMTNATF